jgi:hypothetical protein
MQHSSSVLLVVALQLRYAMAWLSWPTQYSFRNTHNTILASAQCAEDRLQDDLTAHGLRLCHGMFHASGVRQLVDLQYLNEQQIADMGMDTFDRHALQTVQKTLVNTPPLNSAGVPTTPKAKLSTSLAEEFSKPIRKRFELDPTPKHDFCLQSHPHEVFTGRLFSIEECEQLNRMAEYQAYRGIGTVGAGWTNEFYTLTAQHMQCRDVPGMVSMITPRFQQLFKTLYELYPDRICQNSICFDSEGEPHLVKYNGKSKGTKLHTDNSEFIYITVNVALSAPDDYEGGGTYIEAMDETIRLQQGEMLIHLGNLVHAGVEITSGVRRLLIGFLECEWLDSALNKPNKANSRNSYDDDGW